MIRARGLALFDWNGTVVLDEDRARRASNVALGAAGLPELTGGDFRRTFRLPLEEFFVDAGVEQADASRAVAAWNRAMSGEAPILRPGAEATFAALAARGFRLGVVSAAERAVVLADITAVGLNGVFDVVVGAAVDKGAILAELLDEADPAVYVGDTAYDMLCAIEAGYLPVGATGGYTEAESIERAGAEHMLFDLLGLVDIVDALLDRAEQVGI